MLSVLFGLLTFGGLVYLYERYYRGPSDTVLVGTWLIDSDSDGPYYWRLNADHTFETLTPILGELTAFPGGRWYAGGRLVYFRLGVENPWDPRLFIWRIEDVSGDTLRVRYNRGGFMHIYKKVEVVAKPSI